MFCIVILVVLNKKKFVLNILWRGQVQRINMINIHVFILTILHVYVCVTMNILIQDLITIHMIMTVAIPLARSTLGFIIGFSEQPLFVVMCYTCIYFVCTRDDLHAEML